MQPTLIVIAGPTAVGKTQTAIDVAKHFNCPIISADSRQIYRKMEIGTAAPTPAQLSEAKHFMVGVRDVADYYSAYEFERDVLSLLDDEFAKNPVAILTGGSMMYIDVVCRGIDEIPTISAEVRENVQRELDVHGADFVREHLRKLDPEYYEVVDLQNVKRVVHAVEICLMSGQTYTSLRTNKRVERPFRIVNICLNRPREELFERISLRVDQMLDDGLIDEARNLYPLRHLNALNTVGYKEIFDYFDGHIDLPEAVRQIKRNTRRYAKKQLTWFRLRGNYKWFEPHETAAILRYLAEELA